jgi:hypothetical protein
MEDLEPIEKLGSSFERNGTYHIGKTEHRKLEALDVTSVVLSYQRANLERLESSGKHKNLKSEPILWRHAPRVRSRGPGHSPKSD